MSPYTRLRRAAGWLLAAVVGVLTVAVVAHATQAIATPNISTISYSLTSGASSGAITPIASQPVLVMGVNNTANNRSLSSINLLRVPSTFLMWAGLDSPTATVKPAIISGSSGTAGTHMVYLDLAHTVDLRVNTTDTFIIHNASGASQTGSVKLIW